MHFRQFYVGCLAHASYLIGDAGEALVVDPSRDVQVYIDEAAQHGLSIRYVLETHLHADFVSGHRELAALTGATIAIGAHAQAQYPHHALREGDEIRVGGVRIRAIETPGHTPESVTFLVYEHAADTQPWGALTGDTLFVGDVGRVDILSSRLPVGDLAGSMYESLQKLMQLPDATRVYPAHGAGSLCGRSISNERSSTIGQERSTNAALLPGSREAFIAAITKDVPETPAYYLYSRDLNREGPALRAGREVPPVLADGAVRAALAEGAVLLDTRAPADYEAAHPHGALFVSLDGQYASWVGTLVQPNDRLLLLTASERAEEAAMRLARVGYENIAGRLSVEPSSWQAAGLSTAAMPAERAGSLPVGARRVLDVRRQHEFDAGHIDGAAHIPLAQLNARIGELDRATHWLVFCAGGYRATIAASILERAGFPKVTLARGGMDAWTAAGMPVAEPA